MLWRLYARSRIDKGRISIEKKVSFVKKKKKKKREERKKRKILISPTFQHWLPFSCSADRPPSSADLRITLSCDIDRYSVWVCVFLYVCMKLWIWILENHEEIGTATKFGTGKSVMASVSWSSVFETILCETTRNSIDPLHSIVYDP